MKTLGRFIGPAGSQIEVHVNPDGRILWSRDWSRMEDLSRMGYLVRLPGGPGTYGHVDYRVVD